MIGTVEERLGAQFARKLEAAAEDIRQVVNRELKKHQEQIFSIQGMLQSVLQSSPGSPMRKEVQVLKAKVDAMAQQPGSPVRRVENELAALRERVEHMEQVPASPVRKVVSEMLTKEKVEPVASPKRGDRPPVPPKEHTEGEGWSSGYDTGADSSTTVKLNELSKLVHGVKAEWAASAPTSALDRSITDSLIQRFTQVNTQCQLPTNLGLPHSPKKSSTTEDSVTPTASDSEVGSSTPSSISCDDAIMQNLPWSGLYEDDSTNT
eukprot:TRINITY_DN27599_c0_g1_i1.p1 TRINITY_DN27599_c0_g1~~TRINITY_DN27599_c0_g1_i1.p1  ORF type:complete len:286 (+),score=57.21 TRINITY_DN27599_c0_g1_i1:68-859(+)